MLEGLLLRELFMDPCPGLGRYGKVKKSLSTKSVFCIRFFLKMIFTQLLVSVFRMDQALIQYLERIV